jgi:hypothetical protein
MERDWEIKRYVSASAKIYWRTLEELSRNVNQLKAAGDMDMKIENATPDMTTTDNCSKVFYWKQINVFNDLI